MATLIASPPAAVDLLRYEGDFVGHIDQSGARITCDGQLVYGPVDALGPVELFELLAGRTDPRWRMLDDLCAHFETLRERARCARDWTLGDEVPIGYMVCVKSGCEHLREIAPESMFDLDDAPRGFGPSRRGPRPVLLPGESTFETCAGTIEIVEGGW